MAERLVDLVVRNCPTRSYGDALEIGCGASSLAPGLLESVSVDNWVANDIVPVADAFRKAVENLPLKHYRFVQGDMEQVELPGQQDLIVSNAAFQWATSLEGLLERLVGKLAFGGVLAFSTFGPENLREVRELTGLSLEYTEPSAYASIMQDWGEVLCVEDEPSVIEFASPVDVLRHLKQTGVNSLVRRAWTPGDLRLFSERYQSRFSVASGFSSKTDVCVCPGVPRRSACAEAGQVRTPVLRGKGIDPNGTDSGPAREDARPPVAETNATECSAAREDAGPPERPKAVRNGGRASSRAADGTSEKRFKSVPFETEPGSEASGAGVSLTYHPVYVVFRRHGLEES